MSFSKKEQVFRGRSGVIPDTELAQIIADALRNDFGESSSTIKKIGQVTNENLASIKHWYTARHVPSSAHLLVLARSSPSILKFVLEQIGGSDLVEAFGLLSSRDSENQKSTVPVPRGGIYTDKIVSINVDMPLYLIGKLNGRQLWFLAMLRQGHAPKAEDLAIVCSTDIRTARRDVAELIKMKLIYFAGARKNGTYQLWKVKN